MNIKYAYGCFTHATPTRNHTASLFGFGKESLIRITLFSLNSSKHQPSGTRKRRGCLTLVPRNISRLTCLFFLPSCLCFKMHAPVFAISVGSKVDYRHLHQHQPQIHHRHLDQHPKTFNHVRHDCRCLGADKGERG